MIELRPRVVLVQHVDLEIRLPYSDLRFSAHFVKSRPSITIHAPCCGRHWYVTPVVNACGDCKRTLPAPASRAHWELACATQLAETVTDPLAAALWGSAMEEELAKLSRLHSQVFMGPGGLRRWPAALTEWENGLPPVLCNLDPSARAQEARRARISPF